MSAVSPEARVSNPVLRTENISLTYAGAGRTPQNALDNISFSLDAGECVALLGANGAGKTTLLEIMAGLLPPDNGRVHTTKPADNKARSMEIGLVFQFPERQLFGDTVEEDVAFGPNNFNWPEATVRQVVHQALESVGLPPEIFGSRSPFKLSAGERRRVAIAGVLALQPRILLMDEPTAGVDDTGVRDIRHILARMREQGIATLLVSHDMDFVAAEAQRILALEQGRLVFDGLKEEFFINSRLLERLHLEQPAVQRYIASFSEELRSRVENIWDRDVLRHRLQMLEAVLPLPLPPSSNGAK
jgi:energy-coupling factor transport system ATP-binding protein